MGKKAFILAVAAATMLAVAGCHGGGKASSSSEAQAQAQASKMAVALSKVDKADTLAMQACILEAKAIESQYVMQGDSDAVRAFDDAYKACLDSIDKQASAQIFPHSTARQ